MRIRATALFLGSLVLLAGSAQARGCDPREDLSDRLAGATLAFLGRPVSGLRLEASQYVVTLAVERVLVGELPEVSGRPPGQVDVGVGGYPTTLPGSEQGWWLVLGRPCGERVQAEPCGTAALGEEIPALLRYRLGSARLHRPVETGATASGWLDDPASGVLAGLVRSLDVATGEIVPMAGVALHIVDDAGRVVARSSTTAAGAYRFSLQPGAHSLRVTDVAHRRFVSDFLAVGVGERRTEDLELVRRDPGLQARSVEASRIEYAAQLKDPDRAFMRRRDQLLRGLGARGRTSWVFPTTPSTYAARRQELEATLAGAPDWVHWGSGFVAAWARLLRVPDSDSGSVALDEVFEIIREQFRDRCPSAWRSPVTPPRPASPGLSPPGRR